MLLQLFTSTNDNQMKKSIYGLSLILPNERLVMQSINNAQVLFSSATCIHHEFVYQVIKHPQKLSVELDDQSLTYSELLHQDRKSTRLNSSHQIISYAVFCLKKKKKI